MHGSCTDMPIYQSIIDHVTLHLYYTVCLARLPVFPLHLDRVKPNWMHDQ